MPKFRKKPITIDAWQHFGDCGNYTADFPQWILDAVTGGRIYAYGHETLIKTLEGDMRVNDGDWIICGVKGEIYAVRDDIFRETYSQVDPTKHKLTFEDMDGKRSGIAFRDVDPSGSPETFMFSLGCALTALYRHEHEKRLGCPPGRTLEIQSGGGLTWGEELDDKVIQSIIESEQAIAKYYKSLQNFINAKFQSQDGPLTKIKNCARCGQSHEVRFKKLTRPMQEAGNTHWAPCPTNGEPIMMRIVTVEEDKCSDGGCSGCGNG